ncbi:MAG TPA: DUF4173 domain-containing protein, partial [Thermoanaerobaculia bacterium]
MAPESLPHSTARRLALAALALGLAGDLLLRLLPWGLGALLWTLLFLAAVFALLRRHRPLPRRDFAFPVCAALIGAIGLAWRDADFLVLLDVLTLFTALALLSLGPRGIRVWAAGIAHIVAAAIVTLAQSLAGLFQLLFGELQWRRDPAEPGNRFGTVARGVLIALPALLVFGALLSSADAAFAKLLQDLFVVDLTDVVQQAALVAFITAVCIGFFRSLIAGGPAALLPRPAFLRLGAGELTVAMTLLDALFAAFVAVQFRYLFGGASTVMVVPGLTRADYARRGFFELVLVVALVIPMLLVAEWILDKDKPRAANAFRVAAGLQVLLVLVIALSAWRRMALYREAFGLSEQRFYTSAFIIWLAIVLVWLAVTVLAGHRERFFLGMAASGMATLLILHALNPGALVVRTNASRAIAGARALDALYVTTLSADATPAILANLRAMPAPLRPCVARSLLERDA